MQHKSKAAEKTRSARARGRCVNVDSVVNLAVYMYILLHFPVLFEVSVGLLHVVNPVEVYSTTGNSKPQLCNLIGQFQPTSL